METLRSHEVTRIYADAKMFYLGQLVEDQMGNVFEFVKFNAGDGAVTGTAGHITVGLDSAYPDGEVTADVNSATIAAILQDPRGILMAALTDGSYGFVQKKGRNLIAMLSDQNVAQGNRLTADAAITGAVKPKAANTAADLGVALEADVVSVLAVGSVLLDM